MLACVSLAALSASVIAAPLAGANQSALPPHLSITASSATMVGYQIFANVNMNGASNPTGTMTFRLFASLDTNCLSPIFTSTVAVGGMSINSDHYSTTLAETYQWEANYSGDAHNSPAGPTACSDPGGTVSVARYSSNLGVTASGASMGTIRATAGVAGFHPTGVVTFLLTPPRRHLLFGYAGVHLDRGDQRHRDVHLGAVLGAHERVLQMAGHL